MHFRVNFLEVVHYVSFLGFFPRFKSASTYTVKKWVVYIWLIAFEVKVFHLPCQEYTFLARLLGVLTSNIKSILALKLVWPIA